MGTGGDGRASPEAYILLGMRRACAIIAILALLLLPTQASAYAMLAHEAIIDAAWNAKIRPLLLARFPQASEDDLRRAEGFAYGGAIIQDLGYYPHGNRLFSDLVHYVRSGDFVAALLRDSQDIDDYAFALGALSHYVADNDGHALAVNRSVPLLYPKLGRKYGPVVTFEDKPSAHLKMEFGFDVLQVATGRYVPESYHRFIGFAVATPLLERAFEETYGIPLSSLFKNMDTAVGSYRFTVRSIIPKATRVAWAIKSKKIEQDQPGMTRNRFLYSLRTSAYEAEWGKHYRHPGAGDKILAFLITILPKVGPLKALTFHTPTPQAEQMFTDSFRATVRNYERLLDLEAAGRLDLPNDNIDTGELSAPGQYFLADDAYADLLDNLARKHFSGVSPELRANLLEYYSDPNAPNYAKKDAREWSQIAQELSELKTAPVAQSLVK